MSIKSRSNHLSTLYFLGLIIISLWKVLLPLDEAVATSTQTEQQAKYLLTVLENPDKRKELVKVLRALAQLPSPDKSFLNNDGITSNIITPLKNPDGDLISEIKYVKIWISFHIKNFINLFSGLQTVKIWFYSVLDFDQWQETLHFITAMALLIIPLLLVEHVCTLALRPLSSSLIRRIASDLENSSPSALQGEAGKLNRLDTPNPIFRLIRKRLVFQLSSALVQGVVWLSPTILILLVGHLIAAFFIYNPSYRISLLALIRIYAATRFLNVVMWTIMQPKRPTIRLVTASDAMARLVTRWWGILLAIPSLSAALLMLSKITNIPHEGTESLIKIIMLGEHILLAIFIWKIRLPVATLMKPSSARLSRPGWQMVFRIICLWWVPALFLDFAMWAIWVLQIPNGYEWMWQTTFLTIIVIILSRLLNSLLITSAKFTFCPDRPAIQEKTIVHERLQYYYPFVVLLLPIIARFISILVLLQIWGLPILNFFADSLLGQRLINTLITVAISLLIGFLTWESINIIFQKKMDAYSHGGMSGSSSRLKTLLPMLRSVLFGFISVIIALTTLSQLGINIGPLLTGAGILGVAISFGSQKLVQDFITGFFLLAENAMQVGDNITVAGTTGAVESLSIRTLKLRASDGSLQIIPFSSVTSVINMSRNYQNAILSTVVDISENVERIRELLTSISEKMRHDSFIGPKMLTGYTLLGVDSIKDNSMTILGKIQCKVGSSSEITREFNRYWVEFVEAHHIQVPRKIHVVELKPPTSLPAVI